MMCRYCSAGDCAYLVVNVSLSLAELFTELPRLDPDARTLKIFMLCRLQGQQEGQFSIRDNNTTNYEGDARDYSAFRARYSRSVFCAMFSARAVAA